MGKKGGKKAKGPTYYVTDEHVMPFGFRANDIIKTPLGLTGTVIGVKYEQPEQKVGGKLWVGTMRLAPRRSFAGSVVVRRRGVVLKSHARTRRLTRLPFSLPMRFLCTPVLLSTISTETASPFSRLCN